MKKFKEKGKKMYIQKKIVHGHKNHTKRKFENENKANMKRKNEKFAVVVVFVHGDSMKWARYVC